MSNKIENVCNKIDKITGAQKELALLGILNSMGGHSCATDHPNQWLNWFCNDEEHFLKSDTLNRCNDNGWITFFHNSDFDTSRIEITKEGKDYLEKHMGE